MLVTTTPVTRASRAERRRGKTRSRSPCRPWSAGRFDRPARRRLVRVRNDRGRRTRSRSTASASPAGPIPTSWSLDDKDNRVAELDDFGPRVNAFDGHLRDRPASMNLAGKTTYRVLVQDRYRRGGARYQ